MKGDLLDYMRWTLVFGKYSGLMPIVGVETPGEIPRFKWKSFCVYIYIIEFIILIFMVGVGSFSLICSAMDLGALNAQIFIAAYLILSIVMFRFCQRLKHFLNDIRKLEKLLPPAWKPRAAVRYTNQLMVAVIFFGLVEHVLYVWYKIYIASTCFKEADDSGLYIKSYLMFYYAWYFKYFPFSYAAPAIFQIIEIQSGIMWFHSDWIVMCVSIYLRHRFEDFNRLIIDEKYMYTKSFKPSWSELQVHYTRLSQLVAIVDKYLNSTVFFSFTFNLYFTCLNVYAILNNITEYHMDDITDCTGQHRKDAVVLTFQIYDTWVLLIRAALYSYFAAEVNVASRKSLMVMHSTPSVACNDDMKRLMTQIYYSNLGVSGLNIFKITRGMILAMVAQLLTYELVVVQF